MKPGGGLIRLPLRASPVAESKRPAPPAPVLSPLDLEDAGLRVREHRHPVPASFAGAVGAPATFRACHLRFLSVMDRTICTEERSHVEGFLTQRFSMLSRSRPEGGFGGVRSASGSSAASKRRSTPFPEGSLARSTPFGSGRSGRSGARRLRAAVSGALPVRIAGAAKCASACRVVRALECGHETGATHR